MNAYELADELQACFTKADWEYVDEASNMLRQFGLAESIVKQQALDIEEWKRKYKDMHNLATQAMSRNHQLEKEPVKTYTGGIPNYVTENNDKQHNPINNIEPCSSNSCGR